MAQPSSPPPPSTAKQQALILYCRERNLRMPVWQVMSDRRGGRTAWSCTVQVNGQTFQARFWYDGQYVNSAKEDAAERALQVMGEIPAPPGPQPTHYQQQQRAFYGADNNASGNGSGTGGAT